MIKSEKVNLWNIILKNHQSIIKIINQKKNYKLLLKTEEHSLNKNLGKNLSNLNYSQESTAKKKTEWLKQQS